MQMHIETKVGMGFRMDPSALPSAAQTWHASRCETGCCLSLHHSTKISWTPCPLSCLLQRERPESLWVWVDVLRRNSITGVEDEADLCNFIIGMRTLRLNYILLQKCQVLVCQNLLWVSGSLVKIWIILQAIWVFKGPQSSFTESLSSGFWGSSMAVFQKPSAALNPSASNGSSRC